MDFKIIYEDKDVLVINKQTGLVVHPAPGNLVHTLVNALLSRFEFLSDINKNRPGIVHRLDKETSGLLVIAKNNASHLKLAKQFAEHNVHDVVMDTFDTFGDKDERGELVWHSYRREEDPREKAKRNLVLVVN